MYSTVEDVKRATGLRPDMLRFEDDDSLDEWLAKRLEEIADVINRHRMRDFLAEADGDPAQVPTAVHAVALRIATNMIRQFQVSRNTPIMQVNDFSVRLIEDRMLSKDIQKDLRAIAGRPHNRAVRFSAITGRRPDPLGGNGY